DVCSAVYPMAVCSPFLSTLPLKDHGLEWIFPPAALAHPLNDGDGGAVLLRKSLPETADGLGEDGESYRRLIGGLIPRWPALIADILAPPRVPRHPVLMARFGMRAIRSGRGLARATFKTERARALFAGLAAHAMLPLEDLSTAAIGLALAVPAHVGGWPV